MDSHEIDVDAPKAAVDGDHGDDDADADAPATDVNSERGTSAQRPALSFEALAVGQFIDAKDSYRHWFKAKIIDKTENAIRVHFLGWEGKFDEDINQHQMDRTAPPQTHSTPSDARPVVVRSQMEGKPQKEVGLWVESEYMALWGELAFAFDIDEKPIDVDGREKACWDTL